jgi:protein gp37
MAENSNIEWCDHTFNPWEGCQKVGPGCDNCYAESRDKRFTGGTHWGPGAPRRRTSPSNWQHPLRWNLRAATEGRRARVFCASLADVFDNAVPPDWREDLFRLIASTPHLDWLLLTKRPGNIAAMLPFGWGNGWHNVWLGCTVVNQTEADRDIPKLLAVPAAVRFLSMEPLLGPVDLGRWMGVHHHPDNDLSTAEGRAAIAAVIRAAKVIARRDHGIHGIDWVIVGGESGPNARPMHPNWARSLRDQCSAACVAFHFKQWGEWGPLDTTDARRAAGITTNTPRAQWHHATGLIIDTPATEDGLSFFSDGRVFRIGKRHAGRLLDGQTWDEAPGSKV